MRYFAKCTLLSLSLASTAMAQQSGKMANNACTLEDGKEISVRYVAKGSDGKKELPAAKIWMPGGQPIWLFTQVDLSIAGATIPTGAYSLYIIPEKGHWTLIVNKNVKVDAAYDEAQDVARVSMSVAEVSGARQPFSLVFAHVAPKQCNLRIYYGKIGTWAEFKEM